MIKPLMCVHYISLFSSKKKSHVNVIDRSESEYCFKNFFDSSSCYCFRRVKMTQTETNKNGKG